MSRRWRCRSVPRLAECLGTLIALCGVAVGSQAQPQERRSLADLSIEQLGEIQVTSVSGHHEALSDAPSSIFVITAEDIRRSGAASLAEALRLAPNLQVARSSNEGYSISARGLDSALSNKLLVMIDGRSIYTPLYSGVFWDAQDVPLMDIERIEVVSGPGGTLWGTNAVNGVINIVRRHASQTQGTQASLEIGERGQRAEARFGATSAGGLAWRISAVDTLTRHTDSPAGSDAQDAGRRTQLGWRMDLQRDGNRFAASGDLYDGRVDQPPGAVGAQPTTHSGGNLKARWEHDDANGATSWLQGYVEHANRRSVPVYADTEDVAALQWQQTLAPAGVHRLTWGAEYRQARDRVDNSASLAFLPADVTLSWASLYAQDEVALRPGLTAVFGARLERNRYTGVEFLPNIRLAWRPVEGHLLWASLARAVRAPSRLDRELFIPGQPPYALAGGPDFRSELADDAELGYRGSPAKDLLLSVTGYVTRYDRLRSLEPQPDGTYQIGNGIRARASGLEGWATASVTERWRVHAGAGWLHQRAWLAPDSRDTLTVASLEGGNPAHWWLLRSSADLAPGIEADATWRRIGSRSDPSVPAYNAIDLRIAWRVRPWLGIAVGGRNLGSGGHVEFGAPATRSEFEPRGYVVVEVHL